jgi:hypothetical protein
VGPPRGECGSTRNSQTRTEGNSATAQHRNRHSRPWGAGRVHRARQVLPYIMRRFGKLATKTDRFFQVYLPFNPNISVGANISSRAVHQSPNRVPQRRSRRARCLHQFPLPSTAHLLHFHLSREAPLRVGFVPQIQLRCQVPTCRHFLIQPPDPNPFK